MRHSSLRQAATEIPSSPARRALAEIGKADLAMNQVKTYLQSSAHECERRVEAWVASVQSQLASQSKTRPG
jgi:hypothetical protein